MAREFLRAGLSARRADVGRRVVELSFEKAQMTKKQRHNCALFARKANWFRILARLRTTHPQTDQSYGKASLSLFQARIIGARDRECRYPPSYPLIQRNPEFLSA